MGCLAFSPNGLILAAGAASEGLSLAAIHLWDVARGQELHRIPAHQQWVASLAFAPDGKTLASTGAEPVVRLWEVATGREAFPQPGHRSAVRTLVVSPADGTVFTGGSDGTVRHWDPSSGRELGLIATLSGALEALAVAPDGKTLLVVGPMETQPRQVGWIGICSVAGHREIHRLAPIGDRDAVDYVAYSPDGKTVASQGRIWDASSGELLVRLHHQDPRNDHYLSFCPIYYTPDGQQILTAEPDGVRLWDIATGQEVFRIVRWSNYHDRATISPDGRFLATRGPGDHPRGGSGVPPIVLWELASGQVVATLEGQDEDYICRSFSPDGRFLATAFGRRGTIHHSMVRIWDLATGRELRRFAGHRGAVLVVAFTPDGRSVVSGSEDATALVWDVSDLRKDPAFDAPLSRESLQAMWDRLARNDARAAYDATWALSVPSAVAFLREHLHPAASPGPKRIRAVIGPIAAPEVLQNLRAIAALERVGTTEACVVLERMAKGNPGAIETRDSRSALGRLSHRSEVQAGSSIR
jgi:WD40 repeat protein